MTIVIREFPGARPWVQYSPEVPNPKFEPGEALCATPFEGEEFLSFTTPVGKISGVIVSLLFQFRKWGYVRFKIDESIFVSPVFKPYYDLTITQKKQLEAEIKSGLASIGQAVTDFELVWHDLRKYAEYMRIFEKIEKGKRLIKAGKKEEGEKLVVEGTQSLKSVFIDQVDAHTGETIALRSIATRWPTIIVDFMKLKDEDIDPKKIAEKYEVSEAEGVVLATKNKLFIDWRDNMFKPVVVERYKTLTAMVQARKKSIQEYKNMLRPTIARYKMIVDALENPKAVKEIKMSILMPHAHAVSGENVTIWAWKPFAPSEKYKITRETFNQISALKAGFSGREVQELIKAKKIPKDGTVFGLPLEPSIDHIVRFYRDAIEKHYGVKLTVEDIFDARNMLVEQFRKSIAGLGPTQPWVWSPYFIFVSVPITRSVVRLPNGSEFEDMEIENLTASSYSQNLIIVRCLELIARGKQLDNYIGQMLGEYGVSSEKVNEIMSIDELVKKEFPEICISEEEAKKIEKEEERLKKLENVFTPKIKRAEFSKKIRVPIGKFFEEIGLPVQFIRAVGPYEFLMQQRIAKVIQPMVGREFDLIRSFLKTKFGVPGFKVEW